MEPNNGGYSVSLFEHRKIDMLFGFISPEAQNRNKSCANVQCGIKKVPPKATHFSKTDKSWICFPCAQAINRERYSRCRSFGREFTPVAISGEEYLIEVLQGLPVT